VVSADKKAPPLTLKISFTAGADDLATILTLVADLRSAKPRIMLLGTGNLKGARYFSITTTTRTSALCPTGKLLLRCAERCPFVYFSPAPPVP